MYGAALVVIFASGGLGGCGGSSGRADRIAGRDGVTQMATNEYVVLAPQVLGGEGGWCMARPRAAFGLGACEDSPGVGPILAERWDSMGSGSGSGIAAITEGVAVTTSVVTSVSVKPGSRIPTRLEAALPGGVRTVSVALRGNTVEFALAKPRFTPFSSDGRAIPQTGKPAVLSFKAPVRVWVAPEPESTGLCKIVPSAVDGLRVLGGRVVTDWMSADGVPGEPFLSCISVRYGVRGSSLLASVLLDATHPGAVPGSLPAMKPVAGRRGVFDALGSNGPMVARRVPGAWLVVSNGEGETQRLILLEHVNAQIRL